MRKVRGDIVLQGETVLRDVDVQVKETQDDAGALWRAVIRSGADPRDLGLVRGMNCEFVAADGTSVEVTVTNIWTQNPGYYVVQIAGRHTRQ